MTEMDDLMAASIRLDTTLETIKTDLVCIFLQFKSSYNYYNLSMFDKMHIVRCYGTTGSIVPCIHMQFQPMIAAIF
jgi:hypothetical protein